MVDRLAMFQSVSGAHWLIGRHLLRRLAIWGRLEAGIVLDIGCGESPFRHLFPSAERYIRIDRLAVDKDVIQGDLTRLPIRDASVDMVLLFQTLADVPDSVAGLREVARVVRPGGSIVIFESMSYPEHDLPHDYYRIMPAGLAFAAAQVGLQVNEVVRLGGLFARFATLWNTFVMGGLARHAITRPVAALGRLGCNITGLVLDALAPHPRLAPDYLARLVKPALSSNEDDL
jgi:SAM-dependent methyltransferase